ncbi:hypothetical protein K9L27_00720 [Candidatus Gracilibacteria bacterium]|nr:hypothetical protein [Candidatus Gracilibacteria bacterium]
MKQICALSGQPFEITDFELLLRKKFGMESLPVVAPQYRFRHLGAFWAHWNLHHRKCDKTGKSIISVFSGKCPYPVWHKDEWIKNANPKGIDFNESRNVFEQMWDFFQHSPIPHNVSVGCDNCLYTDDSWYCKGCYLCHSIFGCEDLKYSYRQIRMKDSQFCVFTFDSELCVDAVNCQSCFEVRYALHCRNCQDSAFLYDCRNCSNCLFCFNLRNKQYCIGNKQFTKEQFEEEKKKWNLSSRKIYEKAKTHFSSMMQTLAYHRAQHIEHCENSTGDYLSDNKNCQNCFFFSDLEDAVNCARGGLVVKDLLDNVGAGDQSELVYCSENTMAHCYNIKWCFEVSECKYLEYCGHCFQCENCFGCCGLVGKKYYIFNKSYSEVEYKILREKIINHMHQTGEYDQFFPGYFAPHPYEESWSSTHFQLNKEEQKKLGFRLQENFEAEQSNYESPLGIPDTPDETGSDFSKKIFWDEKRKRPFQIQPADIEFCKKLSIPLPNTYYVRRLQENFSWLPFDGKLRKTSCGKCAQGIQTSWRDIYDGRILCNECYLGIVK